MAPQPPPRALTTTIRTNRHSTAPSIYAISHGPQRGVHLLSADPLPAELQYLYRHPINVHRTFLTVTGDFLRRRFDSIDAAVRWIDERDREAEIAEALAGTSLDGNKRAKMDEAARAQIGVIGIGGGGRQRRASDPVYRFAPRSMAESGTGGIGGPMIGVKRVGSGGGIKKRAQDDSGRGVGTGRCKGGRYGMSHVGVRRRELLYNLACDGVEDKVEAKERLGEAVREMFEKEEPTHKTETVMGGGRGDGGGALRRGSGVVITKMQKTKTTT